MARATQMLHALPRYGDGVVQAAEVEACDDGVILTAHTLSAALPVPLAARSRTIAVMASWCRVGEYCGNGKKNGPEACDDGNRVKGDGCFDTCKPAIP